MSRVRNREHFEHPVRLALIENDVDQIEGDLKTGLADLRSEIKSLSRVLIGVLVSLATASALLALNLAVAQ